MIEEIVRRLVYGTSQQVMPQGLHLFSVFVVTTPFKSFVGPRLPTPPQSPSVLYEGDAADLHINVP
jgi:hypothetical protein